MTELRLWRLTRGLTLEIAAGQLGLSSSMLALIETTRLKPSSRQLDTLERGTGIERDLLLKPVRSRVKA
jgi:transcriptional regulator with XRE-family HTH domain